MLKSELVLFVVATCVINLSSALYFHIGETERKCFIEEIPDDTTVLGMYRRHQSASFGADLAKRAWIAIVSLSSRSALQSWAVRSPFEGIRTAIIR